MPVIAARILRALSEARLTEPVLATVGTNALYGYERMAGVQIDASIPETADFDLLYDARASLKLVVPDAAASGIVGVLRKVDSSFEMLGRRSYRAANRDGYIVDLITPAPRDPLLSGGDLRIGRDRDDLVAVEIAGLAWLVTSPKVRVTILDLRGYPAEMTIADPRAFALHKAWLAQRPDRNVEKRRRDRAQAEVIADLVARYLPHLSFDDPALTALPAALRNQAATLLPAEPSGSGASDRLEPDW
jgi:hypothetical protein